MYWKLGRLGIISLRTTTYMEDKLEDKRLGYRRAFDLELLPCVKVSNHHSWFCVKLRWLNLEMLCLKYKKTKS